MKTYFLMVIAVLACSCLAGIAADANPTVKGTIVYFHDGDGVHVLLEGSTTKVKARLYGIDAPELKQDYGQTAKARLKELTADRILDFEIRGEDQYKRKLVIIRLDGKDINLQLLREGMAWHYDRYDNTKEYAEAHLEAKTNRRGLWISDNPVRPEEFRFAK